MKRIIVLIGLLCLLPAFITDRGVLYFITLLMIWGIFALGYDLVFGVAGLLSFGHAAFFGVGSFVFAMITIKNPSLALLGIAAAALAGGVAALAMGAVALRVSGIYFSIMTLAMAELVFFGASSPLSRFTGGDDGISGVPRPAFLGIDFYEDFKFYLFVLVFFAAAVILARRIRLSPFGQALLGLRLNEVRADQLGFSVKNLKLAVFSVSGVFSGVAGALLASLMQFVNPQVFHWSTSADVVMMTLLGGAGSLWGPLMGVAGFESLKEFLSSYTVHWYGVVGAVFVLCTLLMPQGIHGLLRDGWQKLTGRYG